MISDDTVSSRGTVSAGPTLVGAGEFETATGEPIERVLDLATWQPGENLGALYARLERLVAEAVGQEDRILDAIRTKVFPHLQRTNRPNAPPNVGVHQARVEQIERVHRGLLFRGAVEACDGTSSLHDTLPLTIAQIGVALVSYQGDTNSWVQRMYRRDLCVGSEDVAGDALHMLERRVHRDGLEMENTRDTLSSLGRRAIMAYAERAVLAHRSKALWRMGHGNPTPVELLSGSGMVEIIDAGIELMRTLVLEQRRFVFVPSAPSERMLLTIGNALRPLEYAIVETQEQWLLDLIDYGQNGQWGGAVLARVRDFAHDTGPMVVKGIYRASAAAPPQVFYAHVEHAHEAALIAMADSVFQEHRGFPMLIDLADAVCRATFDTASFNTSSALAYADAGQPFRYLAERRSRA